MQNCSYFTLCLFVDRHWRGLFFVVTCFYYRDHYPD